MKRILPVLMLLTSWSISAQDVIGTLNNVSDFSVASLHDSILVKYTQSGMYKRSLWMKADGSVRNDFFAFDIFSIGESHDSTYYYFFEEKKEGLYLRALVQHKEQTSKSESSLKVQINEMILGMFFDQNLFLITFNEPLNQIKISEISGLQIIKERKYILPVPFEKYFKKESSFEFFNASSMLNTFKGLARVKVYYQKNNLYISIDDPYVTGVSRAIQTRVFVLRAESEKVDVFAFPEESKLDFRTFILDSKLFKSVISKEKLSLSIYDLESGKLIAQKDILKGHDAFTTYFRSGKEKTVTYENSTALMKLANLHDPYLVVIGDSSNYTIQWGIYFNDKGAFLLSPFSIASVLVSALATTLKQLGDSPGLIRFFYHEWNPTTNEFKLNDHPLIVRNKVDIYEIDKSVNKIKYSDKSYLLLGKDLLGIYHERNKKTVTFVRFQ